MAKKTSKTEFEVQAVLVLWTTVKVPAKTFEEAVAASKQLKATDLVEIHGEHNDSRLDIFAVQNVGALDVLD